MNTNAIFKRLNEYPVLYKETGWINADFNYGVAINLSNILSFLIQKTADETNRYASDLFISWQEVEKIINELPQNIKNGGPHHYNVWFGLREDGVDHRDFIECRDCYTKVYVLTIDTDDEFNVSVVLYDVSSECSRPDNDTETVCINVHMNIKKEFYHDLQKIIDHHIETFIDLDSYDEILSVYNAKLRS